MSALDLHVLHDATGRILALAPVDPVLAEDGSSRGLTPLATDGQFALRLTLSEEHLSAGPDALVHEYEVDLSTSGLRRRSG